MTSRNVKDYRIEVTRLKAVFTRCGYRARIFSRDTGQLMRAVWTVAHTGLRFVDWADYREWGGDCRKVRAAVIATARDVIKSGEIRTP